MMARPTLFISLRWRLLAPLALVVMLVAMLGAYIVVNRLTADTAALQDRLAYQSAEAVAAALQDWFISQRNEAARIAYTSGVEEALVRADAAALAALVQPMAELARLDSISVVNVATTEVVGVRRDATGAYVISTNTLMSDESIVQRLLSGSDAEAAFVQMPEGLRLVVGVPLVGDDGLTGAVLVGQNSASLVASLQPSSLAEVVLIAADGSQVASTQPVNAEMESALRQMSQRTEVAAGSALLTSFVLEGRVIRAVVAPLIMGQTRLGTFVVTVQPEAVLASDGGRQWLSALAAAVAGGAVLSLMVGLHHTTQRLQQVATTAQAITQGHAHARTRMQPTDEIGVVGQAVDRMADAARYREDQLRDLLTRERREHAYTFGVLESLPEGVLVYDVIGNLLIMNAAARLLLDGEPFVLRPLTSQSRGATLAPGLYALGDPQQIERGGRVLQAQAARVLSSMRESLGTVVLLRDISDEVRKAQRQALLMEHLQSEVEQPLYETLAQRRTPSMGGDFAREIARHAAALQAMIVDMQALTHYSASQARTLQRVLSLETLVWAIANDWRQIAMAANLTLQVTVKRKGLLILGDEGRLRLAIGNLVDNAIKYTPAGGQIALEIEREADHQAYLRVRDNGAGIAEQDLKQVFIPFYRGTPTDENDQWMRVPGMGQGLPVARQIIEAHGGKIKVKSRTGAGTAIYLSLPLTSGVGMHLPPGEALLHEGDTILLNRADIRR